MTQDRKADALPVSTNICDSFHAESGAQVTFLSAPAGATITQSGAIWPFFLADGSPYPQPIGPFPLPGNTPIYVGQFGVGQIIPYNVNNACPGGVQKSVTIKAAADLKKSA
jgi:hypothetical protein